MSNGGTPSTIPTLLLDTFNYEAILELRQRLIRSVWAIHKATRPFACSLIFKGRTTEGIRWDRNVMAPFNKVAEELLPEIVRVFDAAVSNVTVSHPWTTPGTGLVFDNWRILHARPAIPDSELSRTIYRVFANPL
jgi:hypothetical protein